MWLPLSKFLEAIALYRFPFMPGRKELVVGRSDVPDFRGTADWQRFLNPRLLTRVWGPHPQHPWLPFHCLTLFVALDTIKKQLVGPWEMDPWPVRAFVAPEWLDPATMLIVDLPGPKSVALGAALAVHGCDIVCTFNNWPHPQGVIRAERTLATLLRYASWLKEKRTAFATPAPVAWLCDAERLGTRTGRPGEFDNRYYIEDGIMPGPKFLRAQGISKVIYLASQPDVIKADLAAHLYVYGKEGFGVGQAIAQDDGQLLFVKPLTLPQSTFSTTGFFRSSAGGFGAPVPHPSSGG